MARPKPRHGNLPAEATTFIGRRRELAELRGKLGDARLVSLVGPGGVGKTRLAVRAAANLGRGFASGAWMVEICRRLDGLPLAIELAAVRTRVLSAEQIRERLTSRFTLLTGGARAALPRHQTLQTAFECSHDPAGWWGPRTLPAPLRFRRPLHAGGRLA